MTDSIQSNVAVDFNTKALEIAYEMVRRSIGKADDADELKEHARLVYEIHRLLVTGTDLDLALHAPRKIP